MLFRSVEITQEFMVEAKDNGFNAIEETKKNIDFVLDESITDQACNTFED